MEITGEGTLSQVLSGLRATDGTNSSAITTLQQTTSNQASQLTTLSSTVGGFSSSIGGDPRRIGQCDLRDHLDPFDPERRAGLGERHAGGLAMSLPDLSPEQALAMLRQERLQWVDRRATADEKIRTIDAQLAGAEMVLQMQARADERMAAAAEALAETADAVAGEYAADIAARSAER